MRPKENFRPFVSVGLGLTLAIMITFQIYAWREPSRILGDEMSDRSTAEQAGQELFGENCNACHGQNGEGGVGPALNERTLLQSTKDEVFFGLIKTGVPGSLMPAWSQAFGGPFTDQQILQIVAFIRAWEATAPVIEREVAQPDPRRGAAIYEETCFVCHGKNGEGTANAPALNDPARLKKLDNTWYRSTIAHGRPAKGMPTWGTVLSPAQINDIVALIGAWREGKNVNANRPLATFITNALFAIRDFDRIDAIFYLNAALPLADKAQYDEIQATIQLIDENHLFEAESRLISLLPPVEMGKASFSSNCAPCHGNDGAGGLGTNLHGNSFIQAKDDAELGEFILAGRRGTAMDGFEGILGLDEIKNIIALMREWQE